MELITRDTVVEQMIDQYPAAIEYGIMNGVKFFDCASDSVHGPSCLGIKPERVKAQRVWG